MKEKLLNPVRSAPDERYCDWISIEDRKSVRCTNKPMVRNALFSNWKLCAKHKDEFGMAAQIWEPIGK